MFRSFALRFIRILPFFVCAWVMLCLSSAILLDRSVWFQVVYVCFFGLSLIRPLWALNIFLVFMPWLGGSQAGYEHTLRFLLLLSGLTFGASISLMKSVWTDARRKDSVLYWSNPLNFAMLVYWVVAGLSLANVATNRTLNSLVWFDQHLARFFLSLPGSPLYPWLSFVTLSMAFVVFVRLSSWIRDDIQVAAKTTGAILLGSLITIGVGFLDYYDFINLKSVRPDNFEEYFGVHYRFLHMTSVFGNPGWLAQFLTLTAPAMMATLLLPFGKRVALSALVLIMIVTEWSILLAYQRGGWLSYPLTLIFIWFSVYVIYSQQNESNRVWQHLKKSTLKIIITLPLTLLISISLVYIIAKAQPEYRQGVDGFVERASSIKNVNDRTAFWAPTLKLFKQNPVLGGGVDSFQNQYERSFLNEGHLCVHDDPYTAEWRGSAHNLYYQTLAGKGAVGLLSLFGVMLSALALMWRGICAINADQTLVRDRTRKIVLMMGGGYVCALAIYSNVGEIFYFPASYMVFAIFLAATSGAGDGLIQLSRRFRLGVFAVLIIALALHVYLSRNAGWSCY